MRYQLAIAVVAASLVNADPTASAAAARAEAAKTLASLDLTLVGDVWLCREELDVRRYLDAVDPIERRYQSLHAAVEDRVRKNTSAGRDLAKKRSERTALQKKLTALEPGDGGTTREQLQSQVEQLDGQIKKLRGQHHRPLEFASREDVRDDVVRLANARAGLVLAADGLRGRLAAMPTRYKELAARSDVAAALETLGQNLGPAKDYSADAAARLARLDRALAANSTPIYRDDNHVRLVAVVAGTTPVTFSLRHSDGPTHLPHSVAQSLAVDTANAPAEDYTPSPGRTLSCRKVTLSTLQIGNLVLQDVTALVLPPEGEDLGAKLAKSAYKDHYLDVDFAQLRLSVMSDPPVAATPTIKMNRRTRAAP